MRCLRPTKFQKDGVHVSCGQCMPCRINRRSEWQTKLMLEWQTFPSGVFTTLTYNNENLQTIRHDHQDKGTLVKKDLQDFMKRFRDHYERKYGYTKIRYFGVGEYGEKGTQRPHYHILIFNVVEKMAEECIKAAWTKGITQTDLLNENRIKYTIGYTIKKMTREKDFPDGRLPEFTLMSRKPAIGHYALDKFAAAMRKRNLYPSRSINQYQEWILEKDGKALRKWNGVYKQNNKYYRFDRVMLEKLAKMTDPKIKETLEEAEEIFLPREYKARKRLLHDISYCDTIKFVTSEEYDDTKNKSEKQYREFEKSKRSGL